jgi:hypothetical protein
VLVVVFCVAKASAQDIMVDIDWAAFLSRHDLVWDWIWGSTRASTLSPRNRQLHRCGPGGAAGQCCLEATEPTPATAADLQPEFPGFIQLALSRQAPWGCSPTASPPGLCCLPVPSSDISGCHDREEKRWNYNEFFSVVPFGNNGTFQMMDKHTKSCYALATGAKTPSLASCTTAAGSSEQQLWKVLTPSSGHYLVQNIASGTCVTAIGAKEGSLVTMGSCTPSVHGDNSWQPVCDGSTPPLPNWPCLKSSPPHPSPKPGPPPSPPPSPPPVVPGDPVVLATCDGTKPNQQWHIQSSGAIHVGDGKRCLANGGVVAPCNRTGETWGPPAPIDGFFQLSSNAVGDDQKVHVVQAGASESATGGLGSRNGHGQCLQINTPQLFCGDPSDTVCPKAYLQNFKTVSIYALQVD